MSIEDSAKASWLEVKGTVKQKWGKLTDNDLMEIDGSRERLEGKIASLYNMQREEVKKEVDRIWKTGTY
jgi:uncharacterized protein YjbJ (UPF0337 family)